MITLHFPHCWYIPKFIDRENNVRIGACACKKFTAITTHQREEKTQSPDFSWFQVENTQVLLKEGGVQLRLTTVDTPGFGDAVDNSNW